MDTTMKYTLIGLIGFMALPSDVYAQSDWTEEQWKEDMYVVPKRQQEEMSTVATADSKTGIAEISVPRNMSIADKVFVENASSYSIEQMAAMTDSNGDGTFVPFFTTSMLPVGVTKEVMDLDGNLRALKGKKLRVKVKGRDSSSGAITYDFTVSLYERKHDLYVKITSADVFDF